MAFSTSLHDYDIDRQFRRFRSIIGENTWRTRVDKLNAEIRGNKFLRQYLKQENTIAYQLNECSDLVRQYGELPFDCMDLSRVYPALAFATQCLNTIANMDTENRAKAIGRFQGAFRNPEDMRALQFEFTVGVHFTRLGHRLAWPELEDGGDTYDLLVEDIGPKGLEIECKAVSEDKGRQITTRDALEFWNLIQPDISAATRGLHRGLSIVITLPGKLPTRFDERKKLSKLVAKAIMSGGGLNLPEATISIKDFDARKLTGINWNNPEPIAREIMESVTGLTNRQTMITGQKGGGAVICVIQSSKDDTLFSAVQKTAKCAATKQLTGTRPGMILLEFSGLSPEQMVSLAENDNIPGNRPTGLRWWANEFLSNCTDRDHLVGIGFLSRGTTRRLSTNDVTSSGSAYVFARKMSSQWDDAFSTLFNYEIDV